MLVLTSEAPAAFDRFLASWGVDPDTLDAVTAVDVMLEWYQFERAEDVVALDEDGDLLLFQWGSYDWGEGRSFQYEIVRQLIVAEDDDGIWQLSVTLYYPESEETQALGAGHRWCPHPRGADDFRGSIESTDATAYAHRAPPSRIDVRFAQAG